MVLLDTCALPWLVADQTKLTALAKTTIRENAEWLYIYFATAIQKSLAIITSDHSIAQYQEVRTIW